MSVLAYRDERLFMEDVALADIVSMIGSPCYVYSRRALTDAYRAFREALDGQRSLVCYAVKANGNLALLATLADLGAGFDIVSRASSNGCWRPAGTRHGSCFPGLARPRARYAGPSSSESAVSTSSP